MFLPITEEERLQVEEIKERLSKRHLHTEDMKYILEYEDKRHSIEEILQDTNDFAPQSLNVATNKRIFHADSHYCSDINILRFLRGRKHNIEHTFKSLVRHLLWREENEVEKIDLNDFKDITDKKFIDTNYKDKNDRPIIHVMVDKWDKNDRDIDILQKFIIYNIEDCIKKSVKNEEQIVILFDLAGFGFSCMDYEAVQLLINILQYNYPEILHMAIIINSPWIFNGCWMVIRPWLDVVTAAKVNFLAITDLEQYINKEQIPPGVQFI